MRSPATLYNHANSTYMEHFGVFVNDSEIITQMEMNTTKIRANTKWKQQNIQWCTQN